MSAAIWFFLFFLLCFDQSQSNVRFCCTHQVGRGRCLNEKRRQILQEGSFAKNPRAFIPSSYIRFTGLVQLEPWVRSRRCRIWESRHHIQESQGVGQGCLCVYQMRRSQRQSWAAHQSRISFRFQGWLSSRFWTGTYLLFVQMIEFN